jgi:rhodanese-related sulfurtransferase
VAVVEETSVDETVSLVGDGAFLLDVRELDEFEAGHATLATHVPLSSVPDHLDEFPKDRVILCVCRSGGRSARAAAFLLAEGFDARNVTGGMQAWSAADYPIRSDNGDPRII